MKVGMTVFGFPILIVVGITHGVSPAEEPCDLICKIEVRRRQIFKNNRKRKFHMPYLLWDDASLIFSYRFKLCDDIFCLGRIPDIGDAIKMDRYWLTVRIAVGRDLKYLQ